MHIVVSYDRFELERKWQINIPPIILISRFSQSNLFPMKYTHIAFVAIAISLCFVAVEARSKGTVLFLVVVDGIEERSYYYQQGLF